MAKAIMAFTITKPHINYSLQTTKLDTNPCSSSLRQFSSYRPFSGRQQLEGKRVSSSKLTALPHWPVIDAVSNWPLMAVLVEQVRGTDFVTYKSIWHLSDRAIKNVYVFYIFFTCWGCLFFASMKDPYYDSDAYRKDGGDGTGHWVYEKQEDIEESARAELWREELIEEIEQKVGELRELEEAGRK